MDREGREDRTNGKWKCFEERELAKIWLRDVLKSTRRNFPRNQNDKCCQFFLKVVTSNILFRSCEMMWCEKNVEFIFVSG